MASVDALLAAVQERTGDYVRQQQAAPAPSARGWQRITRHALRILTLVDAPSDLLPVLTALSTDTAGRDAPVNAPITAIGYTLGALADTITSNPDAVAAASIADRAELRIRVLNALHQAAAATTEATTGVATSAELGTVGRLADVTEIFTRFTRRQLQPQLGLLATGPSTDLFEQLVARWAESALDVLGSPTRATGYAFQRTATTIAQICRVATTTLIPPTDRTPRQQELENALTAAFQSWQLAAAWPPEVRLGGRTTDLRHHSQALDEILLGNPGGQHRPSIQPAAMQAALLLASKVGDRHETALGGLVRHHGLWILVDALGPAYLTRHPGVHRSDWVPDPGSAFGPTMVRAVHDANEAVKECVGRLGDSGKSGSSDLAPASLRWERVAPIQYAPVPTARFPSSGSWRIGR